MAKINIKKFIAGLSLCAITMNTMAYTQIGTGSVTGNSSYNSSIIWNDNIPGIATGTVNGIIVSAKVLPIINMVISTGGIDLGILNPSSYSTGLLNVEVGTNAANGVTISAKSSNGGLRSTTASGAVINNLTGDGIADSYKFVSVLGGFSDSSISGFTRNSNLDVEVNDNTTSHIIYNTNKPESSSGSSDVVLYVSAKINAQTPAANDYSDTIAITITGNF